MDRCRYGKPLGPLPLIVHGEQPEKLLYPLVLPFREAVSLGVVGGGDVLLDA